MNIPSVWTEPLSDFLRDRLRSEASKKFRVHQLPADAATWQARRRKLLANIWKHAGVSMDHQLDLDYRETGITRMDGYTVKNIYYQSRPGLYATASLYIPEGEKPFPAVILMHGHNQTGHLAERVQACGHLLAKNGYTCISVDAWGSGERSLRHGKFEYHGGNLGSSLMNIGETLMGAQVIDNMRAVDLLCSFDFVDKKRIGATGASGGGNQTMWLAALDERIASAVPVVSVGTFEAYVMACNCICEVLPGGLTFTEESGVLALVAPRYLKICNCLRDYSSAFYVSEMLRSFKEAGKIYAALNAYDRIGYQVFDLPHGYWPEIREAMLGWFELTLKGKGNGSPIRAPSFNILRAQKLMVFKKGKRPSSVKSIAEHCREQGARLRKGMLAVKSFDVKSKSTELKKTLGISKWLEHEKAHEYPSENEWRKFALEISNGEILPILVAEPDKKSTELILFIHPRGKDKVNPNTIKQTLDSGKTVMLADTWGSGETHSEVRTGSLPEYHDLSRAALWLGTTMQSEWIKQIELLCRFAAKYFKTSGTSIHAYRESGTAALMLNAIKNTNRKIILEEAPLSCMFAKQAPGDFFTMGFHLPGILKWGDISLAAAMSNASIEFISPALSDGSKPSAAGLSAWKKEFAEMAAKCGNRAKIRFS